VTRSSVAGSRRGSISAMPTISTFLFAAKIRFKDPARPAAPTIPTSPEAAAAIEAAIRKAAGKPTGQLTQADLEKVTRLELANKGITDLTPLKSLLNLDILLLDHNKITDLAPLADLNNLTQLKVDFNQITDLTSLSGMKELLQIWLHDNQITDLSSLNGMTNLEHLFITNNPDLTKAEIDKLQKALPKCKISHDATK
jgi:hypothetical protein